MASSTNGNNIDALNRSVTKDDYSPTPYSRGGNILNIVIPTYNPPISDLPGYPSMLRDRMLRLTPFKEAMWAAAVHIAVTKIATWDWQVEGRRVRYWQELILSADGNRGLTAFRQKQAKDWLLTDNGCFREYIRATQGGGSRIVGVAHLPSWRCYRTNDRDIPILYYDRQGKIHEMRDYAIGYASDEPDPDYYDVGMCAASRAYPAIQKLAAIELYVYEKVTGKKPSRMYFVNANVNAQQIQDSMDAQKEESLARGFALWQDAIVIPILNPESTPAVAHIDLKGLPENYDVDKERIEAKLTYADCIGLDPVELDPNLAARGRALGSGSQAQVLDDKAEGKGVVLYRQQEMEMWNREVLTGRVVYSTHVNDLADEARRAEIRKTNADTVRQLVGNGIAPPIITPEQAQNKLVDVGDLSHEYLTTDLTTNEVLRGDEKPDIALANEHQEPTDSALMLTEPPAPPVPFAANKAMQEYRLAEKLYRDELHNAENWAWDLYGKETELFADDELITMYRAYQLDQYGELEHKTAQPLQEKQVAQTQQPQVTVVPILMPQQSQPAEKNITIPVNIALKEAAAPNVTMQPQNIQITLPQLSPQFTVPSPDVQVQVTNEVNPAKVEVSSPVTVNTPENIINVDVPQPTVTVNNLPAEKQDETLDVIRDENGLIARVIKKVIG